MLPAATLLELLPGVAALLRLLSWSSSDATPWLPEGDRFGLACDL